MGDYLMVRAEDEAEIVWKKRGWKYIKLGGKIDYFVWTPVHGGVFVEVKSVTDHVRESQEEAMNQITNMGFDCYLSYEQTNYSLDKWVPLTDTNKTRIIQLPIKNCCLKTKPTITIIHYKPEKKMPKTLTLYLDIYASGAKLTEKGLTCFGGLLSSIGWNNHELFNTFFSVTSKASDIRKYIDGIYELLLDDTYFIKDVDLVVERIMGES